MSNYIDMTGWIMKEHNVPDSLLTVIEKVKSKDEKNASRGARWLCKCECGNTVIATGQNLRRGNTKSCGCLRHKFPPQLQYDMTGWIMKEHGIKDSRLTVLNRAPDSKTQGPMWNCICECGNHSVVSGYALRKGRIKSCGCLMRETTRNRNLKANENIVGQQYNYLKIVENLGLRKQNSRNENETWVKCQCLLCGQYCETRLNNVKTGMVKSCGCLASYGERCIAEILSKANIKFKKQYSFSDLVGKRGNKFRFDFAILNDKDEVLKLIEYDGRQHFTGPEAGWTHGHSLEEIKENDRIKDEYCQQHNILLQRIPYTQLKEINLELLLKDIEFIMPDGTLEMRNN